MNVGIAAVVVSLTIARLASAQTASEHVALGDRDYAGRDAAAALSHYQQAISLEPTNAEALWKAARDAVDLGEFADAGRTRDSLYHLAEQYATRAVQANSKLAATHVALARALGRTAQSKGGREKVGYAGRVREEALAALALDSLDDAAQHILGVWNAEVLRLNGFLRFVAKNILGGRVFNEASWDNARTYLERAVALRPDRVVHHLDLGEVYADLGDKDKARQQYEAAVGLAVVEYNDPHYQAQAQVRLRDLR